MPRLGHLLIALVFGVYLFHPAMHLLEHHPSSEVAVEHCVLCAMDSHSVAQDEPQSTVVIDFMYEVEFFYNRTVGVNWSQRNRGPPLLLA